MTLCSGNRVIEHSRSISSKFLLNVFYFQLDNSLHASLQVYHILSLQNDYIDLRAFIIPWAEISLRFSRGLAFLFL